ncbi:hypothetical protein ACMFMF_007547 [Clarireedia jacksonii]
MAENKSVPNIEEPSEAADVPRPLPHRPAPLKKQVTQNPILSAAHSNIPVTPGIHLGAYTEELPPETETESYFTEGFKRFNSMAQSPSEAASGAKSNQEVLRRMSLSSGRERQDSLSDIDPRAAHPSLGLTGGIISATFCIQHSLQYRKGADWTWSQRHGSSAQFDSFKYLASDKSPWNHTLVGWTGEISPVEEMTPPDTPPLGGQPMSSPPLNRPPLNKSSAPIPVDGVALPTTPPEAEGLYITKADQRRLEKQLSQDKLGKTVPVWLCDEVDTNKEGTLCLKNQSRWRRFAEHELYNLFHYKQNEPTNGRAERQSWVDYYRMNQMFANKILEIYKPGDVVMIHDYHLLLLPSMLRQRVPHMYIVFYLHIPFPSSELLRCLPRRKDILEGVLSANLVGLQAFSYTRHFNSCCTRILGFPSTVAGVEAYGARCNVAAFPIGIDARTVQKLAFEDPAIDEKVAALRELYKGKKLIVGRDRLDSVRGVAQKLRAFERFLEMYPEWREKVVLVQVTSPTSVEEEREDSASKIAASVAELVDRINGLYGSLSFWPVQHYPQYLSQEEYLALLRVADVGLITSVRDGMNTTSLEYIVCQKEGHGPLIISEFSGSAAILESAIHINPWDTSAVATNIKQALEMSPEKKSVLHRQLSNYVFGNDIQNWTKVVLRKLLTTLSSNTHAFATPLLDKASMLIQYRAANKRLFMFDYDGTLTPIVKDPAAALPSEKLFRTLKALAADPKNAIWIISGRDQEFLSTHLGHIPELGFSAEHGSFMRHPGSQEWENLAEVYDMGWQKEVMEVFQKYTEATPGSFIERKRCALTWHYRPSDPELGERNSRACQKELQSTVGKTWDVEVMTGKANLEVRPTFINKGEIAKRLVESYGKEAGQPPEFTICLGDDFTDEDMFRSLNNSDLPKEHVFTVTVGASSKQTLARWHLLEPADVISSMAMLNGGDTNIADLGPLGVVEGRSTEMEDFPGDRLVDNVPEGPVPGTLVEGERS